MMFYFIYILAFTHYIEATCSEGCGELVSFYEDVGCDPVYTDSKDCCPSHYNCTHLTVKSGDACFLKEQSYKLNQKVPSAITYGSCQIGCFCSEDNNFICAVLDCPEVFGGSLKTGCRRTYELDKCCSVGTNCEPIESQKTCTENGKTYYVGDKFQVDGTCLQCVCAPGYKREAPFCQKIKCLFQLSHSEHINQNCAVTYFDKNICCPHNMYCPKEEDVIVKAARTTDGSHTCQFGNKSLNIGDTFQHVDVYADYHKVETKCECKIPPFVTCITKNVYDLDKAPDHIRPYLT